ncbi:MAG: hypothetical protein IJ833_04100 [Lachnospiraceae bacterium]|nr:hypothetical protein [Lachnospiraceae bacterium]
MKQKEKIAEQEQALVEKDQELRELTLKIEDVDRFVDEVSETAYQKACEVVADSVREKTQQEDMKILRAYQKWITSPDRKTLKMIRDFIGDCLDELARAMTVAAKTVTRTVQKTLQKSEVKEAHKEPIKNLFLKDWGRSR